MAKVIINETHSILEDQKRVLDETFPSWERFDVPEKGWSLEEIRETKITLMEEQNIIFCSPVPALLLLLASERGGEGVWTFHNDRRVAKELPNGKIIHQVAPDGWVLV